jgi:peptidoglycan/xylan/chitin deacetylase (PgdA/CDA1 family)
MVDVLEAQRGGAALPPRAVLVTFDDAYRDFRENAWPVLDRLGIPVTLFVPTAYPDRPNLAFWWDRIWAAVMLSSDRRMLKTHLATALRTNEDRGRAAMLLVERHKALSHEEARSQLASLDGLSSGHPAESQVLGWDELRQLSQSGVFLAPHSRSHPILTALSDVMLNDEIKGSRDDLASQVPAAAASAIFAYPVGRYDGRVLAALRALRFELAFTTERGTNRLGQTDPLRMRRINVGHRADAHLIRLQIVLGNLQRRVGDH